MERFTTNGGYFAPQGYMKVGAGGSHEENPNGGVQVGVDPEGAPNLLEEGEPVYKDFVYSDNITISDEMIKTHNLPTKLKGKLYSEAADWFVEEAEDRPLDNISNSGLEKMLGRLADAQEEQKALTEQAELEEELSQMSPEDLDALEAMISQEEQPMPQEEIPIMGQQQMFHYGGPFGRTRYNRVNWGYDNSYNQFNDATGDGSDEAITSVRSGNTGISDSLLGATTAGTAGDTGTVQTRSRGIVGTKGATGTVGATKSTSAATALAGETAMKAPPSNWDPDAELSDDTVELLEPYTPGTIADAYSSGHPVANTGNEMLAQIVAEENARLQNPDGSTITQTPRTNLPTWMRYAGIANAGLSALHNIFQSEEDDRYHFPRVNPVLPAERMHLIDPSFTPMDANISANEVLASNAGTLRALQNAGLGGTVAAAMLAADMNTTGALGKSRAAVYDANNNARNAVITSRNQNASLLGQFNYGQSKDRAHILNDAAYRNAQNAYMEHMANQQLEAQKYAAIQSNLEAMAEGLSGIGQENLYFNMANRVYPNYWVDKHGNIHYEKA